MRKMILPMSLCLMTSLAGADARRDVEGIWVTDGYGWLLHIAAGEAQIYQYSGDICIKEHPSPAPLSALLPTADLRLSDDGETLTLYPETPEPAAILARRIDILPQACIQKVPNTPQSNFDAFATFFAEHYAFFDLYDVDWAETVATVRPKIGPKTTDQELFAHMTQMMAPIQDAHVSLSAEIDGAPRRFMANRGRTSTQLRRAAEAAGVDPKQATQRFYQALWYESIAVDLLGNQGAMIGDDLIQFGMLEDGIGYLAVAGMGGFADGPEMHAHTQALFDSAIGFFNAQDVDSLILDLSFNLGGHDYVARELASRFATEPFTAYTKYAADAASSHATPGVITPSTGPRFDGEVLLLTSNITVSAGEVLTIAMRGLPNVTHVGEPTRGAFSDILSRRLPNDWRLNLSNYVYLDSNVNGWEGRGVTPHMAHIVFSDAAPVASHAQLIKSLVETLR